MHRGLPEGNTKLVLILAMPWALPTIGPGLHEFLLDLSAPILGFTIHSQTTFSLQVLHVCT